MEFQKLIEKRRSVRKYSAGHTIPKEDILEMIRAAQEAPSWKNSQTGRYYCLLSEEMTQQFRTDCLPSGNALKSENAALIVTTFVHNRSGFRMERLTTNLKTAGAVMILDFRTQTLFSKQKNWAMAH